MWVLGPAAHSSPSLDFHFCPVVLGDWGFQMRVSQKPSSDMWSFTVAGDTVPALCFVSNSAGIPDSIFPTVPRRGMRSPSN